MLTVSLTVATALFALAAALGATYLWKLRGAVGRWARFANGAGAAALALGLGHMVVIGGLGTLGSLRALPAELALVLAIVTFVVGWRTRFCVLVAFTSPVSAVIAATTAIIGLTPETALATAVRVGHPSSPLAWLHVSASALGMLLFLASYVLAALYVLQDVRLQTHQPRLGSRWLPSLHGLERLMYRTLFVGFVLFTVGAVLGIAWAQNTIGTGSLRLSHTVAAMAWACFAIVLALRWVTGWSGRRAAFLIAFGFVANLAVVMGYYARVV